MAAAKILLIDDDPDFVEAIRTVLESVPYEVVVAYDGGAGLAKVREDQPDLVLLDIIMPTPDGFHVCEKLKSDPALWHIPVIMLTSSLLDSDIRECYDIGANSYIVKPVSFGDFAETIKSIPLYWLLINKLPGGG